METATTVYLAIFLTLTLVAIIRAIVHRTWSPVYGVISAVVFFAAAYGLYSIGKGMILLPNPQNGMMAPSWSETVLGAVFIMLSLGSGLFALAGIIGGSLSPTRLLKL